MALSAVRKYRRAHNACEKAVMDLRKAQERVEEASARQARAESELAAVMSEAVMSAFPDMPRDPDGFIQFIDDVREGYELLMRQREDEASAIDELLIRHREAEASVTDGPVVGESADGEESVVADGEAPDVIADEQAVDAWDGDSDVDATPDERDDMDG